MLIVLTVCYGINLASVLVCKMYCIHRAALHSALNDNDSLC